MEPDACERRGSGVPFGDERGQLTDLFFLVCSHDEKYHLHILARLIRMMDTDTLQALRDCKNPHEALEILVRREEQVLATHET